MVLVKCWTPCFVCRVEKLGLVISGKLPRSLSYSFPVWEIVLRWSAGALLHKAEMKNKFRCPQVVFPSGKLGANWPAGNQHLIWGGTSQQ